MKISSKLKIAYSNEYVLPLPEGHKFPIDKYKLIPERLINEGTISEVNIFTPSKAELSIVELTHDKEYVSKLVNLRLSEREIRKIGFPLSKELIEREFIIAGGTIKGALSALDNMAALNVAGGTHHAYAGHGEGFCLLNDVAVASNYLLHKKLAERILIIDLDVHQGNGTAKIFENNNKVFTLSMHGEANYPLYKEKSDLDIPLKYKTDDYTYLKLLYENLPQIIKSFQPDFLFYISGVDVLHTDKWGRLSMTIEGCAARDRFVFETAKTNKLPVMVSMGGGYSPNINEIVEAHCNTFRISFDLFS